jgi:hypothetical protein
MVAFLTWIRAARARVARKSVTDNRPSAGPLIGDAVLGALDVESQPSIPVSPHVQGRDKQEDGLFRHHFEIPPSASSDLLDGSGETNPGPCSNPDGHDYTAPGLHDGPVNGADTEQEKAESPPPLSYCVVCQDDVPLDSFPSQPITSLCNHPLTDICIDSIQQSIVAQMDYKAMEDISCPHGECRSKLCASDMRIHARPETYVRYENIVSQAAISKLPNFVWCSAPGCSSGQIHLEAAQRPMVTCVSCHAITCFTHRGPWHEGFTCHDFDDPGYVTKARRAAEQIGFASERARRSQEAGEEKAALEARLMREAKVKERRARRAEEAKGELIVRKSTIRCIGTGCMFRVKKDENCKHVTCICRREFCWICWKPWVRGHLSERCSLGREEAQRIAEEEKKDTFRIAEQDRVVREVDEQLEGDIASNRRVSRIQYVSHSVLEDKIRHTLKQREEERQARRREEELGEIEAIRTSQRCVGCSMMHQKVGSNHIICQVCRAEFCWGCRKQPYPRGHDGKCRGTVGRAERRRDRRTEARYVLERSAISAANDEQVRRDDERIAREMRAAWARNTENTTPRRGPSTQLESWKENIDSLRSDFNRLNTAIAQDSKAARLENAKMDTRELSAMESCSQLAKAADVREGLATAVTDRALMCLFLYGDSVTSTHRRPCSDV